MEENKFLIYPAKRRHYFLSCGEIGGFSGFLKKSFRQHDYQLGRKNCQTFLRYYFGEDPVKLQTITGIRLTPGQLEKWSYDVNYGKKDKPKKLKFPLRPDMLMLDTEKKEISTPEYNGLSTAEMEQIINCIDTRIKKITDATYPSLIKMGNSISGIFGFFMRVWPLSLILKNKIRKAASGKVSSYLHNIFPLSISARRRC